MFFAKILLGTRYIQSYYILLVRHLLSKLSHSRETIFDQFTHAFYSKKISESEKAGIDVIESLRKKLLRSNREIKRVEFGEGSNVLSHAISTEKVRDICRIMSKSESECHFLYAVIRTIKPAQCIELGTCLGISTAYIGQALAQNSNGKLASFEGTPDRAAIAIQNIKELHLDSTVTVVKGRFQDSLQDYIQNVEFLDFAFIDGHHQEEATLQYFNTMLPKFIKGGIIIFDDIYWSRGMNRAWKTIKSNLRIVDSMVYRGMGVVQITVNS